MRQASGFGARLRALRRRKGKTQLEVANELKAAHPHLPISQANVSHLERRERLPRSDILSILADYFGVNVTYFHDDAVDSFEQRRPQIASYFQRLKSNSIAEGEVLLHTDDNRSGDKDTLDTTDNLAKFYRDTDITGK